MDKSGAGAFVYAKASGILGKSFIGERASALFEQKSLSDLWTLIFRTPAPVIPETLLAEQIEREAFARFIKQYTTFVGFYSEPDQILIDQLFIYESENLKAIGAALCSGEDTCPHLIDIGKFASLRAQNWPDIGRITARSAYSWYDHVPDVHEQQQLEFKIDLQVIRHLWSAVEKTGGEVNEALKKLYLTEYIIKNIVWVLRLRLYYKMEKRDIMKNLIYVTDAPTGADPVAAPALHILEKPLDEYEAWADWKYAELLNPHTSGEVWVIDPSWIERLNRIRLNNLALNVFHQFPMTSASLIGWYKIKNYELSCIRTAVESLRLNMAPSDAKDALGIH